MKKGFSTQNILLVVVLAVIAYFLYKKSFEPEKKLNENIKPDGTKQDINSVVPSGSSSGNSPYFYVGVELPENPNGNGFIAPDGEVFEIQLLNDDGTIKGYVKDFEALDKIAFPK